MRFLKAAFKIVALCVLIMALFIGAIAVYMRFYGNAHIKEVLSGLIGAKVDFTGAAVDLDSLSASFKDLTIDSEVGFEGHVFNADIFRVSIDKEIFDKERRVVFDRIYVKGAKLHVIRDARGKMNLIVPTLDADAPRDVVVNAADASPAPSPPPAPERSAQNGLYTVLKAVKTIAIEDSVVFFEDQFKMPRPYKIYCDKLAVELVARDTGAGYLSATVTANCRIPQQGGDGWLGAKGNIAVYPGKMNMELTAGTGNIDILLFSPYFQRNTPFYFRGGKFSSTTDFRMHEGTVDALTTMSFGGLRLSVNPYGENAQFLNVPINRLAPYLTSGGNLIFDFVMTGDARRPRFGVGPRVKYAIGMVVMEEVGKAVAQMQW